MEGRKKKTEAVALRESAKVVRRSLLAWFARNRRADPWRDNPTPYSIWVAEVMLQQTVVKAVVPYFNKWMMEFPDIASLAVAQEQKVLRVWEGLGYYSRARNLHKAAKLIVSQYGGRSPASFEELKKLPGIGDYTAAAIMSIAFGQPFPVIDANVRRVVRRILAIREESPLGERRVREFLEAAISTKKPGEFNEAMMELGQTVCRNRQPSCEVCPVHGHCQAVRLGIQGEIPKGKSSRPQRKASTVLVISCRGKLLLEENNSGLFARMYTLPKMVSIGRNREIEIADFLGGLGLGRIQIIARLPERTHLYTKFIDRLSPVAVKAEKVVAVQGSGFRWVRIGDLEDYPMPSIHRKIVADYIAL